MPTILLKDILQKLNAENLSDFNPDEEFKGLTNIWQDAGQDSIYVAIGGSRHDGHDFIEAAIKNGAKLIVASNKMKAAKYPVLIVENTRQALSKLAALFTSDPSKKITLLGVTGTNGKTTTNWMIYHLLLQLGLPAARLGTLGLEYKVASKSFSREGNLTTPDAVSIQKDLNLAFQSGAVSAVMELSSHALDQFRVEDLHFDNIIYTNLTRDHLDYHKDMDSYFEAKAKILTLLQKSSKKNKVAIVNIDCNYGLKMLEKAKSLNVNVQTFGKHENADYRLKSFSQDLSGSKVGLSVNGSEYQLRSKFIGYHNVENAIGAIISVVSLGHDAKSIIDLFQEVPQVPGRLESVGTAEIGIFVDYAHTPDALENVAKSLKQLVKGNLWIVFGCGGDRDKGKRPQMAAIAAKYGDKLVVTSDNPRTEDPQAIIADILSGGTMAEIIEPDRRAAIEAAIRSSRKGDVILIAGKGHENYQILGTEKIHFSDVEEVERVLNI